MGTQAYREGLKAIDWSVKMPELPRKPRTLNTARADFPAPMLARDYDAYECPVTGRPIEGRAAHRENLKRTGCRILERGEFEDVKKNGKKRLEEKIDAAIDASVEAVAKDFL